MDLNSYVEKINNSKIKIDINKYSDTKTNYEIRTLNKSYLKNDEVLSQISYLRNEYNFAFRNRIDSSINSTIDWLKNDFFIKNEKILFLIFDKKGILHGHAGLHIHNENKIEIDNVIKNENSNLFKMGDVLKIIETYAIKELEIKTIILKVLKSNQHALNFYKNNGYFVLSKINQKISKKVGYVKLIDTVDENNYDDELFTLKKTKISVVIPSHNSENSITILLDSLIKEFKFLNLDFEIIIIDDKSSDNTIEKINEYKITRSEQNINIYKSRENLGQIASTIFGVLNTSGDFILTIDDDLQHNPKDFSEMYNIINNSQVDVVVGFWNVDETFFRNITSILFNFISNLIRFKSLKFRNTAYRLFRKKLVKKFLEYFIDKNWIDMRFITKSIVQIKTDHNPPYGREFTKTKYRLNVALKYLVFDTYLLEIIFIIFTVFINIYFLTLTLISSVLKLINRRKLRNLREEFFYDSINYTKI